MTNSKRKTAAFILLLSILCTVSMYIYTLKYMSDDYLRLSGQLIFAVYLRQIIRTAVIIIAGFMITRHLTADKLFLSSVLLFVVPNLIWALPETDFNCHLHGGLYRIFDAQVYLTPFIYLGILLLSYLTAIRREIGSSEYYITYLAIMLLSCYSAAFKFGAVGTALVFAAAGTVMLLLTLRSEKSARTGFILLAAAVLILLLYTVYTYYTDPLSPITQRLTLVLTGGRCDPAGRGFHFIKIREALHSIRLIGRSSFRVGNVPAVFFLSQTYWNLDLLIIGLLGGWIAVLCIIAAQGYIIAALIRNTMRMRNPLTRQLGFFIACLFAVRLVFSVLSSTIFPLSNTEMLMFFGGWNRGIDAFLLIVLFKMMRMDPQYEETGLMARKRSRCKTDLMKKVY